MFSLSEVLSNTITQKLFLSHNTEKKLILFPTMWTEWTQFFPLGFSLSPSDSVDALLDAWIEPLPAESSANTHTRSDTYSHSEAVQPEAVLKVLRAGWFGVRIRISCCCLHENQLLQQVKLSAADRVSASCWTHNTCLCCRQDLQQVHNKFIISEATQWKMSPLMWLLSYDYFIIFATASTHILALASSNLIDHLFCLFMSRCCCRCFSLLFGWSVFFWYCRTFPAPCEL